MTLTTEQIREILEGAPEQCIAITTRGHVEGFYEKHDYIDINRNVWRDGERLCKSVSPTHMLSDLRTILEKEQENETLRQRVEELEAQQSEVAAHSDDEEVHQFACAMKEKMAAARAKGREGWETCDPYSLAQQFVDHLTRCNEGNYLDLANYCMMLHQRGESPIKLAQMVSRMKD